MMKKKKKKKIITHNKQYHLKDSPLFNITYLNLKRLNILLNTNNKTINSILENKIENYHCFMQGKRGVQVPLYEMYNIHNRIASLLARIITPQYLYSGIKNKSYIDNAKQHLDNKAVFTTDITSFFPSTTRKIIFWFFKDTMECSSKIANTLADLCTINGHLPTGSQISMPLAYWANAKMFDELNQLAEKNSLKMTVYVDDITFSGEKIPKGFKYHIEQIIKKHQHNIKLEKTTLYRNQSVKEVTGLILKGNKVLPPHRQLKNFINIWNIGKI